MSQGSKTPKHILHFISKESQVQHTWFCRGAPQAAGEEMGSCLCCSSFNWGETNPTHILQAFVVAGGLTYKDSLSNRLSSVLTLLPESTAWTPLASLPRAMERAQASVVGGKIRVASGDYVDGSYRSEVMIK